MKDMNFHFESNEVEVIHRLLVLLESQARCAIAESGVFRIGLSGGSLVKYLTAAIPRIRTDLTKWRFFFCDERFVEESSDDSTAGVYKRALLPMTKLKDDQFVCINLRLTLAECAKDYEERILKEFQLEAGGDNIPEFDLLLLGMGPDGHTCSLFPGHALLNEKKKLIAAIDDSPKPPPLRVTMTFPLINNAKCCLFAMCGAGKAEMVKRVFADEEHLPAGMVAPINRNLFCILDDDAGKLILDYFEKK